MEWIQTEDIQVGDIVETPSKIPMHSPIFPGLMFPIIKHYGIIIEQAGRKCIVHNIIGRRPTITPCDEVFTDRKVERVLRTGMCQEEILNKYDSCKNRPYNAMTFNCETLVTLIWGSSIGFPQQYGWSIGVGAIIVLVVLIVLLARKNSK